MPAIAAPTTRHRPLRAVLSAACAVLVAGCADGRLSPVTVSSADTLLPSGQPTGGCFGDTKGRRPAPGDRIQLTLWSAGILDQNPTNTDPPLATTVDLPVRLLASGDRMDATEQRVLATFLQVNRGKDWAGTAGGGPPGVSAIEREGLARSLERHQDTLWNAFVGSLCLKSQWVFSTANQPVNDPSGARRLVFTLEANLEKLCEELPTAEPLDPTNKQDVFARAFLGRRTCAPPAGTKETFAVLGQSGDVAAGGWASTALDANAHPSGGYYYAQRPTLYSPSALLGTIHFGAVRPFRDDSPDWTLAEWEKSGICGDRKIRFLRLRQGVTLFQIRDASGQTPSHIIVPGPASRDLSLRDPKAVVGLDRSLPHSALDHLTARDVDELLWVAERDPFASIERPEGCVSRERG